MGYGFITQCISAFTYGRAQLAEKLGDSVFLRDPIVCVSSRLGIPISVRYLKPIFAPSGSHKRRDNRCHIAAAALGQGVYNLNSLLFRPCQYSIPDHPFS